MSEHEWKPCPFCGSPAEPGEFWHENASHGQNRVWCSRNECELGRYRSEGIYPDEWQARPIEDAQAAQIAELRQRTRELHSVLSAAVLARDSARARATDLKDRLRAIQAERDALMGLIVQPWTRPDDGAELHKINLAWLDTTETREQAESMVFQAAGIERAGQAGGEGTT